MRTPIISILNKNQIKMALRTFCRRALDIIDPIFVEMCVKEQNMLGTEEGIEKFLPILPNEEDRQEMTALFNKESTSEARWHAFVQYIESKRTEVQLYNSLQLFVYHILN